MAEQEIKIPDIGGASGVEVIELLVKAGDKISKDSPLITLESDKASMEIPSPIDGEVKSLLLKIGDKVSEGDVILVASLSEMNVAPEETKSDVAENKAQLSQVDDASNKTQQSEVRAEEKSKLVTPVSLGSSNNENKLDNSSDEVVFAGPAVRRLARELGVDLEQVRGTGIKERITKEDIQNFVKQKLTQPQSNGLSIAPQPKIDFSKFGDIDVKPLTKIKKLTGINLHNSWVNIPHVTQFDEADITDLESFRKLESLKLKDENFKLTLLAFVCKVVYKALVKFPEFNSSLQAGGESLIYKKYYNIGFAADTPNGLVVPVIWDIDKLTILEIAKSMSHLSAKARDKGLSMADMSGGCFTISSLGGIGGTAFTPIINSPEVAILGLSRSVIKPVYIDGEFKPRLMLPLSLSYDHRVIDGAQAAYFIRYIRECLSDIKQILL